MSYRLCSHVPVPYFDFGPKGLAALFAPPKPIEEVGRTRGEHRFLTVVLFGAPSFPTCVGTGAEGRRGWASGVCMPSRSHPSTWLTSQSLPRPRFPQCAPYCMPYRHTLLPRTQKKAWVGMVVSNCDPPSNRTGIVKSLMDTGLVQVDSWGSCLRNMPVSVYGGSSFQAALGLEGTSRLTAAPSS